MHGRAEVTLDVPHVLAVRGLGLPGAIPGADGEFVPAGRQVERERPQRPAGRRGGIGLEVGLSPAPAAVARHVHAPDRAAARHRPAAQHGASGRQDGVRGRLADRGVDRHLVDRLASAPIDRVGRPDVGGQQLVVGGLDRAGGGRVAHGDGGEPLGAADAGVARHHDAKGEAVLGRQRLTVHRGGEQDVRVQRLAHGDRRTVVEALAIVVAFVQGGEGDVQVRPVRGAGGAQHVDERDPRPGGVADRARSPWIAADRAGAPQVAATVAGALHHRRHGALAEPAAQVVERQGEGRGDEAGDAESVRVRLDRRHVAVATDVEVGLLRPEACPEPGGRGFGVVGSRRVDDGAGLVGQAASSCRVGERLPATNGRPRGSATLAVPSPDKTGPSRTRSSRTRCGRARRGTPAAGHGPMR